MGWYVYMLRCGDNTLYTGITDDVEKRLAAFDPERLAISVVLPREGEYASLDK